MKKIIGILIFMSSLLCAQGLDTNEFDPRSSFPVNQFDVNVGKYGLDTIQCEENLTIYNEFYKQKSYDSALKSWFYLFFNAPKRTKNIYIHGVNMYKNFIKNEEDSIKREILIDNLLQIYDQRNTFYPGQEGLVIGYKGADLYRYRKSNIDAAKQSYDLLKKSFNIENEKSTARALNYYFSSAAKCYQNGILTKEDLIDLFSEVSNVVDYKDAAINQVNFDLNQKSQLTSKESKKLKKNKDELEKLINVRSNMEKILAPHVSCEKLETLYQEKFETKQEDPSWLERAAQLLKKGDCIDTQIYFQIAGKLYELNPTPKSAFYMGYLSLKQEDYSSAVNYFSQAVSGEDDQIKKADYLLYLAKTYAAMGSNAQAKKHALQANQNRSGWGAPFMLIGDLYAQTSRACGKNTENMTESEFSKRVGYWAALEKYTYAKKIDSSVTKQADEKIKQYTDQAPDKTSTFQMNILDQPTYKIECGWYTEVVQNPYFSN